MTGGGKDKARAGPSSSSDYHQLGEAPDRPRGCYAGMMKCLGGCLGGIGSIPLFCCFPNPYKSVQQGHVGLVTEYGRFTRMVDSGLVYVNPVTENLKQVDVRLRVHPLPPQVIFTRDNVSVNVDCVLYWRVADAPASTFKVDSVQQALVERAMITMREVCSVRDLQDMMTHRESMAEEIKHIVEETASSWGIHIEAILIKDILMGAALLENLSAAAVAKRQGASKVIAAQAEVEAARLMREASDIMATPAAMQFRYLETLQKMSSHANSRVIFVPTHAEIGASSLMPAGGALAPGGAGGMDVALKASLMDHI